MKLTMKHLTFAIATVLTIGTLSAFGNMQSVSAVTGDFTEWDAIAFGHPVRDFNPHATVLDLTGATGFPVNMPWYTIDNRSPGPPCALGHLDSATDTLCSWGFGSGIPIGVAVDDTGGSNDGAVWATVRGSMSGVGGHVAFLNAGAGTSGSGLDTWTHMLGTDSAAGITLDSVGNAYYAEIGGFGTATADSIAKVTPTGTLTRWSLPANDEPRFLAFDSTGDNLYFTAACSRDINRLNIKTNDLTRWSYPTAAACSTNILDAFGIFLEDDNAIWYADTLGNKVARLSAGPDTILGTADDVITEFSKAMNSPQFIVVSSANQAFITERFGNTVDILDVSAGGGVDTTVKPTTSKITLTVTTPGTQDVDRKRECRVQPPTTTTVTGVDPPNIVKFPYPTILSQPIGITDVVQTDLGAGVTKFGIFGDAFARHKIFLFESEIIIPTATKIEKNLLEGPKEIGIYLLDTTEYVYEILYSGPAALVIDFVPAEFDITSLEPSAGSSADSARVSKGKGDSAEKIEWKVPDGSSTLTVTIETVESKSQGKVAGKKQDVFKPTSCGPLPINDGATPFEVDEDGKLALDPDTGLPIPLTDPSNSLGVEAIEGTKLCCLTDKDCNDNNACTDDVCNLQNRCEITVIDPDDKNVCTDDSCDPATGVANTANTASCDDSNACTTADTCSGKECVGGSKLDCGVSSECVAVFCDSDTGCGKKLLDGIPCAGGAGVCSEGVCKPPLPDGFAVACICSGDTVVEPVPFCVPADTCEPFPLGLCESFGESFGLRCGPIGFCGTLEACKATFPGTD